MSEIKPSLPVTKGVGDVDDWVDFSQDGPDQLPTPVNETPAGDVAAPCYTFETAASWWASSLSSYPPTVTAAPARCPPAPALMEQMPCPQAVPCPKVPCPQAVPCPTAVPCPPSDVEVKRTTRPSMERAIASVLVGTVATTKKRFSGVRPPFSLTFFTPQLKAWREKMDQTVLDMNPETSWRTSAIPRAGWRAHFQRLLRTEYPETEKLRDFQAIHKPCPVSLLTEAAGERAFERGNRSETNRALRNMQQAFAHYVQSLCAGYAPAMVKVAEFYIQGYNTVKIDYSFAKMLLLEAWRRGEHVAGSWLARLLSSHNHIWHRSPQKEAAAEKWLLAAEKLGCPLAIVMSEWNFQFILPDEKAHNRPPSLLYDKAASWLRDASAFYPDCAFLNTHTLFVASSRAEKKSKTKALCTDELVTLLSAPLSAGHAESAYWMSRRKQSGGFPLESLEENALANFAEEDKNVLYMSTPLHFLEKENISFSRNSCSRQTSVARSLILLRQAAAQRLPDAVADFSTVCFVGTADFDRDLASGFVLALKAARLNAPNGFWNLALSYTYGWGCTANVDKAKQYFERATLAGHVIAPTLCRLLALTRFATPSGLTPSLM